MAVAAKAKAMGAAWLSLISNIVLTVVKLVIGILYNSGVLIADGIHNAGDIIATAAAFSSMRISNQPADEDHPYGHGKAEVLGAGIVAVILGIAAVYIAYHSVMAFFEPPHPAHWIALIAAFVSFVWKQALYVYTMRIGKQINSKGLVATAIDHLADVYASIAAVIGIGLALAGDYYGMPLLGYGDPLAGIVVAYFVMKLAIHMGKDSIDILMEKNVSLAEKIEHFHRLVKSVPEVKRIDRLRAREHGHYMLVDIRVGVPAKLTIQQGHDISRQIKKVIMDSNNDVDEVLVHLNPWYEGE